MAPAAPVSGRILLTGGTLAGTAHGALRADLAVQDGHIVEISSSIGARSSDTVIDCSGRVVMPGFIDAHSHAEGLIADPSVQAALLRQGITTIIGGQDGVSYSPGDGSYGAEYFAAINGPVPRYHADRVGAFLDAMTGISSVNVAMLIPAGTVRYEVCGRDATPATAQQRAQMRSLVVDGLLGGAVGVSTGLDYVPGLFQDAAEIAALCGPLTELGGVYVTHMRGGYETNARAGVDEILEIISRTRSSTGGILPVHISHLHAAPSTIAEQIRRIQHHDPGVTFDAYPYVRGCSLLAMPLLPPELTVQPVDTIVTTLEDDAARRKLRAEWLPRVAENPSLGPGWADAITFGHIDAAAYGWAHGLTITEAARRTGKDPADLVFDVLAAARLRVNVVMATPRPRSAAQLAQVFAMPEHMAGSDGIFIGDHPHPRTRGTFARYLREQVREHGNWDWDAAATHLATVAAKRFHLGDRGILRVGAHADIAVVDPSTVSDQATYEYPIADASGIDDVLVAGIPVLRQGALTGALPGRGIRRTPRQQNGATTS